MKAKILTAITLVTVAFATALPAPVFAVDCLTPADCAKKGVNSANPGGGTPTDIGKIIKDITNLLLFILGAVSVIMVVIGGFKYVVSNGDSSQTKSAKDTILYAVIGLIVALLAYAIVNFVLGAFLPTPPTP